MTDKTVQEKINKIFDFLDEYISSKQKCSNHNVMKSDSIQKRDENWVEDNLNKIQAQVTCDVNYLNEQSKKYPQLLSKLYSEEFIISLVIEKIEKWIIYRKNRSEYAGRIVAPFSLVCVLIVVLYIPYVIEINLTEKFNITSIVIIATTFVSTPTILFLSSTPTVALRELEECVFVLKQLL